MSLRPLAYAASIALACSSTEPPAPAPAPSQPAPSPPASTPVDPATASPPVPLAVSTLPWVWYHAYPAELSDTFSQVGTGPVAYAHHVGDRRRYDARRLDHGTWLVIERLPEPGARGEAELVARSFVTPTPSIGRIALQALSTQPTEVVMALRIPGGYERHVTTGDGAPRVSFIMLDPPGFDSPDAAIQLGGTSERPVVYVRGTSGAYLDEIDPGTGKPLARAGFGEEVLHERFPWPPEGPRGRRLGHRWPAADGGHYRARRHGDALELLATDATGKERWRTTLDPKGAAWSDTAVLLEHAQTVLVVVYRGLSSGATAHGLDPERGTLRFTSSPGSLGPIGHSRYHNEVALSPGDAGRVLVHGHEAGGDYLGVLDVEAGRLLGHEVWRR